MARQHSRDRHGNHGSQIDRARAAMRQSHHGRHIAPEGRSIDDRSRMDHPDRDSPKCDLRIVLGRRAIPRFGFVIERPEGFRIHPAARFIPGKELHTRANELGIEIRICRCIGFHDAEGDLGFVREFPAFNSTPSAS